MQSVILRTASALILQIMLVVSLVMVLRGHNYPGGGFIGGLIAVSGVALYSLAGVGLLKKILYLIPAGIVCITLSAVLAWSYQQQLLSAIWMNFFIFNNQVKIGTPILFDFGIYFIVVGSVSWFIKMMEE